MANTKNVTDKLERKKTQADGAQEGHSQGALAPTRAERKSAR